MTYPIISAKRVAVGTAAVSVEANCNNLFIKNEGGGTLYFTEQGADDTAVTAETGFALAAGETFPAPLSAKALSMIATAETTVSLLYVGEGW